MVVSLLSKKTVKKRVKTLERSKNLPSRDKMDVKALSIFEIHSSLLRQAIIQVIEALHLKTTDAECATNY